MKKTFSMIVCASALIAAVSCSEKETQAPVNQKVSMEFSATTPQTKTAIQADGTSVVWSENDNISIFDGASENNKFYLVSGAGTASATFRGSATPSNGTYYAIYPYAAENSISGTVITATLPSVQYSNADATFATMLNPAVAKADQAWTFAFAHVAGMLKVIIEDDGAVKSIALSADQSMTGQYTVDMSGDSWTAAASDSETATGVTLKAEDDGNLAAGPYYMVVLPGTYTNVSIVVTFADGRVTTGKAANMTVTAGQIVPTTITSTDAPHTLEFVDAADVTLSYTGDVKTYTVNSTVDWKVSADSEDITVTKENETTVRVSAPYSKYIYDKTYTITISPVVAGQAKSATLTLTQGSCIDANSSNANLSENGTITGAGLVRLMQPQKYGKHEWTFSNVNIKGGCFVIQDWTSSNIEGKTGPYIMLRFGPNIHSMAVGGEMTISNWSAATAYFGYDNNGWSTGYNITMDMSAKNNLPSLSEMTKLAIEFTPARRSGVSGASGIFGTTIVRKVYINDVCVIDGDSADQTQSGWKNLPTDIWASYSDHKGMTWQFGLSDVESDTVGDSSITIDTYTFTPYSAE